MRRRDPFPAERTVRGRVRGDIEAPKRFDGDVELRSAAGAVDQHGGPGDVAAGRPYRVERLLHRAARGHDVVDHDDPLARSKRKSAAELAASAALAPFRIDRSHAQLSCHLVREDDPSRGRACHGVDIERLCPGRDGGTQALRLGRMLKHLELLEIQR